MEEGSADEKMKKLRENWTLNRMLWTFWLDQPKIISVQHQYQRKKSENRFNLKKQKP